MPKISHLPVGSAATGTETVVADQGVSSVTLTVAQIYACRTLTGPAAGLTITNGNGTAGNPTIALANDLAAIEALSSTGIVRRTGSDAYAVGQASSSLVDFLQAGTGAVTRTAQSKMRDAISVKDLGAIGDGSTDDTAAIQAAVDAAVAVGYTGGVPTVYFPAGRYKITGSITHTVSVPIVFKGEGGFASSIELNATTGIPAFSMSSTFIAEDLYFSPPSGVGSTGSGNAAFYLSGANGVQFNRVEIHGYQRGIDLNTSYAAIIQNCRFRDMLGYSLVYASDSSANGTKILNNTFLDCGASTSSPAVLINSCLGGIAIIGNDVEGCYAGFLFAGVSGGVAMNGNYIEGSTSYNIYFASTCSAFNISGNFFGACPAVNLDNLTDSYFGLNSMYNWDLVFVSTNTDVDIGPNTLLGTATITGETAWHAPTLGNSWVNEGGSSSTAGYRQKSDGTIELKGQIKSGSLNTVAFTLPAAYRPVTGTRLFPTVDLSAMTAGWVSIATSGDVTVNLTAGDQVTFDGIRFSRR